MVTRRPRPPVWAGTSYAHRANAEDSGKPGSQPVNTETKRHEDGLEEFAKNAVKVVTREGGSQDKALRAGEKAHNAAEKTIKPR